MINELDTGDYLTATAVTAIGSLGTMAADSLVRGTSLGTITVAKVQRAFLYALPSAVFSVATCIAKVNQLDSRESALLALSFLVCGAVGVYFGWNIKDYQDPIELLTIKDKAQNFSFSKLESVHGLANVKEYGLVSPDFLVQKFHCEFGSCSFSSLINHYSLATIQKYQLMEADDLRVRFAEELMESGSKHIEHYPLTSLWNMEVISDTVYDALSDLSQISKQCKADLNDHLDMLDLKYPFRTEVRLQELDRKRASIDGTAHAHQVSLQEKMYIELREKASQDYLFHKDVQKYLVALSDASEISKTVAVQSAADLKVTLLADIMHEQFDVAKVMMSEQQQTKYDLDVDMAYSVYHSQRAQLSAELNNVGAFILNGQAA